MRRYVHAIMKACLDRALNARDAFFLVQTAEPTSMSPSKLAKMQATEARQQQKQKRKAEEGQLQVKRHEMDKAKVLAPFSSLSAPLIKCRLRMPSNAIHISSVKQNSSSTSLTSRYPIHQCLVSVVLTVVQKARDPEYAALLDSQPKPKGRGRKKAVYV